MTIQYTPDSMFVPKDGYYLVSVLGTDRQLVATPSLCIAEALVYSNSETSWSITGCDYDVWKISEDLFTIKVICAFDLEAIAKGVKGRESASHEEALNWYAMELEALATAVQSQNHAVIAACMTVLCLDGGKRARNAI